MSYIYVGKLPNTGHINGPFSQLGQRHEAVPLTFYKRMLWDLASTCTSEFTNTLTAKHPLLRIEPNKILKSDTSHDLEKKL